MLNWAFPSVIILSEKPLSATVRFCYGTTIPSKEVKNTYSSQDSR